MSNHSYDDDRYGVVERKWFGLTKKHGGDCAAGYTFGTTDATSQDHLARWYPKGPIKLQKFGYYVLGTVSGGGTGMDVIPARLLNTGSAESDDVNITTGAAPYSKGSTTTFTSAYVDAGSYLGIQTGTPQTGDGTAANTATSSGTVAFFVDYVRAFSAKWDAS